MKYETASRLTVKEGDFVSTGQATALNLLMLAVGAGIYPLCYALVNLVFPGLPTDTRIAFTFLIASAPLLTLFPGFAGNFHYQYRFRKSRRSIDAEAGERWASVTLRPRIRKGIRSVLETADDMGVLRFFGDSIEFRGSAVEFAIPYTNIRNLSVHGSEMGLHLCDVFVRLHVEGLSSIEHVDVGTVYSWTLFGLHWEQRSLIDAFRSNLEPDRFVDPQGRSLVVARALVLAIALLLAISGLITAGLHQYSGAKARAGATYGIGQLAGHLSRSCSSADQVTSACERQ